MSKAREGRSSLYVAIAGLSVAVLATYISYYIPNKLDGDARSRERNRICIDSVIDLRVELDKIDTGYIAAPDDLPERLADWDGGTHAIERARVSCRKIPMSSAGGVEDVGDLWKHYDTAQNVARNTKPALGTITEIRNWTTASIRDLTATD